jgi:hypothetical protein
MAHFMTFLSDGDTYSGFDGSFVVVASSSEADEIAGGHNPGTVVESMPPSRIFRLDDPADLRRLAALLEVG